MLCSCLSSYGRAWECDWGLTYTLVSSQVDADSNTRSRAHNRTTATAKMTAQTIYGFVWVVIASGATPKGDHSSRDISCSPLTEKKTFSIYYDQNGKSISILWIVWRSPSFTN